MSWISAPVTATSRSMPANEVDTDAHRLTHRQRVLEQAVQVGLVVELRRRRPAEPLPHRPRRSPNSASSSCARCGLRTVPIRRRRSASICSTLAGGRVHQVREAVVALLRRRRGLHDELGAVALGDLEPAPHADRDAGLRQLVQLARAVPRHGLERARAVAHLQPQVVLAVALLRERCAPSRAGPCPRPGLAQVAHEQGLGGGQLARVEQTVFRSRGASLIGLHQLRSRSGRESSDTRPGRLCCPVADPLQTAVDDGARAPAGARCACSRRSARRR